MEDIENLIKSVEKRTCGPTLKCKAIDHEHLEELAKAIRKNTNLRSLVFNKCDIGGKGARILAKGFTPDHTIDSLNLGNNNIGTDGLRAIANALKLVTGPSKLLLFGNLLTAEAGSILGELIEANPGIKLLNVGQNLLGDEGLERLAGRLIGNTSLHKLMLKDTKLTSAAATTITNLINNNNTLVQISLLGNELGELGARMIAAVVRATGNNVQITLHENDMPHFRSELRTPTLSDQGTSTPAADSEPPASTTFSPPAPLRTAYPADMFTSPPPSMSSPLPSHSSSASSFSQPYYRPQGDAEVQSTQHSPHQTSSTTAPSSGHHAHAHAHRPGDASPIADASEEKEDLKRKVNYWKREFERQKQRRERDKEAAAESQRALEEKYRTQALRAQHADGVISELRTKVATAATEHKETVKQLQDTLALWKKKEENMRSNLMAAQKTFATVNKKKKEALHTAEEDLRRVRTELKDHKEKTAKDAEARDQQAKDLREKIAAAGAEIASLRKEYSQKLEDATRKAARLGEENKTLQKKLHAAQETASLEERERKQIDQRLREATAKVKELEIGKQKLDDKLVKTVVSLQSAQDQMKALEHELQKLKQSHTEDDAYRAAASAIERVLNFHLGIDCVEDRKRALGKEGPLKGGQGKIWTGLFGGLQVALKEVEVSHVPDIKYWLCGDTSKLRLHDRRVLRELKAMASLRHPHIVPLLGTCKDGDDRFFIMMPWAEHGSLSSYLHERDPGQAPLTKVDKLRIACEIASGMEFLHMRNVVHRDLKSGNVLLTEHMTAQVCDFGLSAFKAADSSEVSKMPGTTLWASPEQLAGKALKSSTDVFSYGCVVWELMFGIKPWHHLENHEQETIEAFYDKNKYLPLDKSINGQTLDKLMIEVLSKCFQPADLRTSFRVLRKTLQPQYIAEKHQKQVDEEQQHLLLHGPPDAPWKFPEDVWAKLSDKAVQVQARKSVSCAVLDLYDDTNFQLIQQLLDEAGGRTSREKAEHPFGRHVAGAAIVHSDVKNTAFNGVIQRDQARFKGNTTTAHHVFRPKYQLDQNGHPKNKEMKHVLGYVCKLGGMSNFKYHLLNQDQSNVRIQRVFHGVPSLEAAVGILGGEFAQLQTTDQGWYGSGFYFTPDLEYALAYARPCPGSKVPKELHGLKLDGKGTFNVVLVCDVVYGNPYPVIDLQHVGKTLVAGHDAHVVVTDFTKQDVQQAKPFRSHSDWTKKQKVGGKKVSARPVSEIVVNTPDAVLVRAILIFHHEAKPATP
ncbi:serine/threonine protein kinase [Salpingoeca rosetta]|uniref:Serine/threonine protein kinase n=1 Tax=Salpingoeca rosetta (strain ATCC 50818 / BSB-021) TaxID=946362 RepID=F2UJ16_SALR5|nr:serine/threonine protein kinase [Salpingoeca rosetta]EGD76964.1 serine/threonine protein kinase [Salpingoeca rosetta]|eukprot:XP_004990804.1 serine/threonine protein kinase [Salpingoeca rosetta]